MRIRQWCSCFDDNQYRSKSKCLLMTCDIIFRKSIGNGEIISEFRWFFFCIGANCYEFRDKFSIDRKHKIYWNKKNHVSCLCASVKDVMKPYLTISRAVDVVINYFSNNSDRRPYKIDLQCWVGWWALEINKTDQNDNTHGSSDFITSVYCCTWFDLFE